MIRLPAYPSTDLDWNEELKQGGDSWHLDFGFDRPFDLYDEGFFSSCALAVEEFARLGLKGSLSLYAGDLSYLENMKKSERFEEERENTPVDLFCTTLLSEYLHRLASLLPDELPIICHFDVSSEPNQAKLAQLFSERRFEHFTLNVTGAKIPIRQINPVTLGVVLPLDDLIDQPRLNRLFEVLGESSYKIIPEERLNELWDGIDEIIILSGLTSAWGQRMLQGFKVTGGEVKEFGVEGFEPPTHCSQSNCASQTALYSERQ